MNKEKTIFYIILVVEILTVVLAGIGIVEKEAVLIMTGLLVFYFIFSKVEDSLILFIISIPLFIALPITEGFDSMANWRILLLVLFLKWFFVNNIWGQEGFQKTFNFKKYNKLTILAALFLIIGFLSLIQTVDVVAGVKKLLFLINIFLLFVIVKDVIQKNSDYKSKIIKSGAIAGVISLIIGYSQLISVMVAPLYTFWQWWSRNVISVFYGIDLSKLLAVSNTWFSYYEGAPPTLRMFSIFPDSHSFALFTIIGLIFFSYLLIKNSNKPPRLDTSPSKSKYKIFWCGGKIFWIPITLSFLTLVFSGSRGVWVSGGIPFLIIIFLLIFKNKLKYVGYSTSHIKPYLKAFFIMLMIFALAFPVSSLIMSQSYQGADGTLAFKRAKTLADLEELSVKSRMEIWQKSLKSILKRPILGVGIGNYPVVLDQDISTAKKGASAHNLYLDITSEIGILGLIVLLLIFWQILKRAIKVDKSFGYIFAFFFIWILIYNLFDVVLLNDKVLLLFMIPLALLYSNHE